MRPEDPYRRIALEVLTDNGISRLRTTITNQDGTVVLYETALVYKDPPQ